MAIFDPPPTESTPLNRSPNICYRWLRRWPLWLCQILLQIRPLWNYHSTIYIKSLVPDLKHFGANGWNKTNLKKNLFITFFRELTYRSDPSTDFHAWWLKQRWLAQWCAFWGFVDIAPHFGGEIPPRQKKSILGAWMGVFKPNGQNIECFILSKLLHRFQLNFAPR